MRSPTCVRSSQKPVRRCAHVACWRVLSICCFRPHRLALVLTAIYKGQWQLMLICNALYCCSGRVVLSLSCSMAAVVGEIRG